MTGQDTSVAAEAQPPRREGTTFVTAGVVALAVFLSVGIWSITPHVTLRLVGPQQTTWKANLLRSCPPVLIGVHAVLAAVAVAKEFFAGRKKPLMNFIILLVLCVNFMAWMLLAWWAGQTPTLPAG